MKKTLSFLWIVTMFISPSVAAASSNGENVISGNEVNQQLDLQTENEEVPTYVEELTLEDVLTRGLDHSRDLKISKLNIEILKNEVKMAINDRNKATEKLEDALSKLEIKKENVKQNLTSTYFNLLILEKKINLQQHSLLMMKKEVNRIQELFRLGRATQKQLNEVRVSNENAEKALADLERNYQDTLGKLTHQIGICYHPDIELNPIKFEVEAIVKPDELDVLIENTNQVKTAERSLETAKSEQRQAYGASNYERENHDYHLQIAEHNLETAKDEAKQAIEQLFRNAEASYLSYQAAAHQLKEKEKELQRLYVLFDLGRLSGHDFEKAGIGFLEAELKVFQAKLDHYKINQSIHALENGLSI